MGAGLAAGTRSHARGQPRPRDWVEIAVIAAAIAALVFGLDPGLARCFGPLWSPAFLTSTAASFLYKGAILVGGLLLFLYATEPKKTGDQADKLHVPFTRVDWERIAVCVIISLFSIVFWMGFEQSGGTLNLFADQETNRTIFGWNIPASVFQSINPVFIISLAPVFAILWTYLARHQFPLPSVTKQGLGLIMLAAAFGSDVPGQRERQIGAGLAVVADLGLSHLHGGRAVRFTHRAVAGQQTGASQGRLADDGVLVRVHRRRQLSRRDHGANDRSTIHWNLWIFLGVMALVPGLLLLALTPVLVKMSHGRV